MTGEPAPAAPDTAALREAIVRTLTARNVWIRAADRYAEIVTEMPEVAALIVERDQAVAQVQAVREVATGLDKNADDCPVGERTRIYRYAAKRIRRALGNQP